MTKAQAMTEVYLSSSCALLTSHDSTVVPYTIRPAMIVAEKPTAPIAKSQPGPRPWNLCKGRENHNRTRAQGVHVGKEPAELLELRLFGNGELMSHKVRVRLFGSRCGARSPLPMRWYWDDRQQACKQSCDPYTARRRGRARGAPY